MSGKLYALHDPDLKPAVFTHPTLGECLSVDAVILLARDGITPKAKRIYRAYLKHRRRLERTGLTGKDLRLQACVAALGDFGHPVIIETEAGHVQPRSPRCGRRGIVGPVGPAQPT